MIRLRRLWPLLPVLLLAACARAAGPVQRSFFAMGTLVEVTLYDVPQERAERLLDDIEADFQRMHHEWHAWEEGPLVHVNRAIAQGRSVEIPAVIAPLLPPAIRLSEASNHLFNPAIGRLIALWGFQSDEPARQPPDPADIERLVRANPRMTDLVIEDGRLRSRNPMVQLDFGGFAKGWAIDRVIEKLRAAGVENAIVNAGGDLRAIGRHGNRPWRVGVRHPRRKDALLAVLEVQGDESVFTSGDYERYFEYQGRRYHHIIDPRTGWPAEGAASVTLIHREAATADAAATALLIAHEDEWREIARRMGIDQVLRVEQDGRIVMTPAMARRARLLGRQP